MADYKEGIVESIKIATLEKQIEILEKLGLSKDEILEKMSDENTDILTIILNKIDSLYEQEEQALVEQLARTLLANQSEASVKYVIQHELIGKVLKHILENDSDNFEGKTIDEILQDTTLSKLIIDHDTLRNMMFNSSYFSGKVLTYSESYSYLLDNKEWVLDLFRKDSPIRESLYNPKHEVPWRYCLEQHAYVYYRFDAERGRTLKVHPIPQGQELIPIGAGVLHKRDRPEFTFVGYTSSLAYGVTFANGHIYTPGEALINTINVFPVYIVRPELPNPPQDVNHVTSAHIGTRDFGQSTYTAFFIAIPTTIPGEFEDVIISPFKGSTQATLEFNYLRR